MKWIVLLFMLPVSMSGFALDLSQQQFEQLQKSSINQQRNDILSLSSGQAMDVLVQLAPAEKIWLTQLWLERLAELEKPGAQQTTWVEQISQDQEVITLPDPDHPRHRLRMVDPAGIARALLYHWQLNQLASDMQASWKAGNWDWQLHLEAGDAERAALSRWWQSASASQLAAIRAEYLNIGHRYDTGDNRLIATLLKGTADVQLISLLWHRPVDQYTYQILGRVPQWLSDSEALDAIEASQQVPQLQSQAILLLARHYSHHPKAQKQLLKALGDNHLKWFAASAMGLVEDADFRQQLRQQFSTTSDPAVRLALSRLQGEAEL